MTKYEERDRKSSCPGGGIGIRGGLKIPNSKGFAGSTPALGTIKTRTGKVRVFMVSLLYQTRTYFQNK